VIGEWVPTSEPGVSDITRGNEKWLRGRALELILVGSIPACAYEEFVIHNRFAHLRLKGEWFVIEEELLQFIADFRVAGVLIEPEESRLAERMQNWQRRNRETALERHDAQRRPAACEINGLDS
jgi:hypothetical protein